MDQQENKMILEALRQQSEPVSRNELMILSGVLESNAFNNALSYLESKGEIVVLNRRKIALPEQAGYAAATIVRQGRGFSFA